MLEILSMLFVMAVDTPPPDTVGDALARRAQTSKGLIRQGRGVAGAGRRLAGTPGGAGGRGLDRGRLLPGAVTYSRVHTGVHYPATSSSAP
jgi:hypothetical protein